MRRFVWPLLVISSVWVGSLAAETRPQYGGTLHIAVRETITSLDPADNAQADSFARRSITGMIFDTLVTRDEAGRVRGSLAEAWQAPTSGRTWHFRLRRNVKFHDGATLTPEIAAASLRAANAAWTVSTDGDSLIVEAENEGQELLSELALPRNAIQRKDSDKPSGTGPFHVVNWQPGKSLALAAEENCWSGRPYLDGVEIEMGKSYRDQMVALDSGHAELVEVAAEQTHRASLEGRGLMTSPPMELLALVFTHDAKSPEEKGLREALAWSVERGSMRSVILQGAGEPAGGVIPNWMSGYEFVFPTEGDLARARRMREQVRSVPAWTLGYDSSDATARTLAERVALNARDAGLALQVTATAPADLRLMRIPLGSLDPWIALEEIGQLIGVTATRGKEGSADELYKAEQSLLATRRIIPLFHLPASYAMAKSVHDLSLRPDGGWRAADAWLGSRQP